MDLLTKSRTEELLVAMVSHKKHTFHCLVLAPLA